MNKWIKVEDDGMNDDDGVMWKPENTGDFMIGRYTDKEENIGLEGNSTLYFFENDDGKWKTWGSKLLDSLMDKIGIGTEVKIVYQGKRKSQRGSYYKVYEVFTAEDEGEGESPSKSSDEPETHDLSGKQSDEEAVNDIITQETGEEDMVANSWLNKVTNDMIGEQRTVTEKTLKAEIYNLSQIPTQDNDLGTLDIGMAARVFKVIDKKGY